jgi:HAD superfamily phosphatase (TIGR01668 family)
MPVLVPNIIFKDITRISVDYLNRNHIKCLVLDVDNTLTQHGSLQLDDKIAAWLYKMKISGIKLMLASNNKKKRVAPFAAKLGLPYIYFSCKPSPLWLYYASVKFKLPKKNIALCGDQIFTDLLAGSLYGAKVLLVRPTYKDTKPSIVLKRKLESPFLLQYYKNGGQLI